jgi:hypothetical protein
VFGKRALLLALVVEVSSQGKKANKHNELKDKSCFQKSFAHRLLAPGIFDVRPIANSVPVEGFDDGGDAKHGGEHAARVNWRMIWEVIENPAENLIVHHFIKWTSGGQFEYASSTLGWKTGDVRQ